MNNKETLLWDQINWTLIEQRVTKIQKRIYKQSKLGNKGAVVFLQNLLITSLDAKLLAVRRVTLENQGKHTPGIDLKTTSAEKAKLVKSLHIDGKALPIRRVWIPKPGKKDMRPLGIPIIKDRAKQKLVLMALEPEWEAKFEPNSYGFRPGRRSQDAIEAIFMSLRNKGEANSNKYVLDADLKGCFDNIDHDYLIKKLNTSPKISNQIRAWLKAGIFEGQKLDPPYPAACATTFGRSAEGTPQGGVISPFLSNVALHGMEEYLKDWICNQTWEVTKTHQLYKANKIKSISIIRYADDFVIIHKDKNIVLKAQEVLQKWLDQTSKLKFNTEKTSVINSNNGFNFLGFSIITHKRGRTSKCKIYPAKKNVQRITKNIGEVCRKFRSISTYDLIEILRPRILGWANYYKYCECQETFSKVNMLIFNILRAWVFRRDRRHGRIVNKEKYFPSGRTYAFDNRLYKDNWVLVGKKKAKKGEVQEKWLPKIAWVKSSKYIKVASNNSVYDTNDAYWALRTTKYGDFNTKERNLLKKQKGICPICKGKINDNIVEIDHIIPKSQGGKDTYSNLQLLHKHCHSQKTKGDIAQLAANPKKLQI